MTTGSELVLDLSGRRRDGRKVQMRLVLEKQLGGSWEQK
jgi:hypothetical protein